MKKELTDLELEKVNAAGDDEMYVMGNHFYDRVYKYDGIEGREYYAWLRQHDCWFRGTLTDTWEDDRCFGTSQRRHKLKVTDAGYGVNTAVGEIMDISGDEWFLFEHATIINRSRF